MIALERAWLRENHLGTKNRRKQAFKDKRTEFDKQVRLSKRRYKQEKVKLTHDTVSNDLSMGN